jgi:hypothetical protein
MLRAKNILIEYRFADGKLERLPELAAELVRLNVNIIVTAGNEAVQAAKNATQTIRLSWDSAVIGLGQASSPAWRGPAETLPG